MDPFIAEKLRQLRSALAAREGVEPYRIFTNDVLVAIATERPTTRDGLLKIKGFKEKKFAKYGTLILSLLVPPGDASAAGRTDDAVPPPLAVSVFLNMVNDSLAAHRARIVGEVSSCKIQGHSVYFSLTDMDDGSVLQCYMSGSAYSLSGVELSEGMEVILEGFPEVYKPSGRLSFRASLVELGGEGALKKAYEELKRRLAAEGVFAPERKRPLPLLPQKIGLITSRHGAVIHDFRHNLGKFGLTVRFMDSRVEGAGAVTELLAALAFFEKSDVEAVALIRGGGSLESLQAFNNEHIVRKIAEMPMPVVCGIGHDQDVPLAALAADRMASTPTAAAVSLTNSWERAREAVVALRSALSERYAGALSAAGIRLSGLGRAIEGRFGAIVETYRGMVRHFERHAAACALRTAQLVERVGAGGAHVAERFGFALESARAFLERAEQGLMLHDPMRPLALGYSIVAVGSKVVKSVDELAVGTDVRVRVSDGTFTGTVREIKKDA